MTYQEFEELYRGTHHNGFVWIHAEKMDIGGARISKAEIDQLSQLETIDKIMISGLRQDTFEYFIETYGKRIKYLYLFKNKMVEDLSVLSTLRDIFFIHIFHNQRVTKLWDMTGNMALEGLVLDDFTRLHSLDGVQDAPVLQHLHFGDKVWSTSTLVDLKPLENTNLVSFTFQGKSVEKNDVSVYTKLPALKFLKCGNLYTTEELAYIVAKCPSVEGPSLQPYVKYNTTVGDKDVFICGKGKPYLNSVKDAKRIERYVDNFNKLVTQFREKDM